MINFNECRITADGKHLIIDVSVIESEYFENVYIDNISIDNQKTYVEDGPSKNPLLSLTDEQIEKYGSDVMDLGYDDEFYTIQSEGSKRVRLVVHRNDPRLNADLNNDLFFVYVHVKGVPHSEAPCDLSATTQMKAVVNMYPVYKMAMEYISQVEASCCDMPDDFVDMMIRIKAFEVSLKTSNYTRAIKYWGKYFKGKKDNRVTHKCGCHGR